MCANNNFRTRSLEWQSCECAASFFWRMFGIKSFVEDFNWPGQLKKSPTIWSHLPSPHIETFKRFDQQIHTFYVVWRCWEHYHSIFELHTKCWFVTQISSRNVHAISYKYKYIVHSVCEMSTQSICITFEMSIYVKCN